MAKKSFKDKLPDPAAEAEAQDLAESKRDSYYERYIKPGLGVGATGVPMGNGPTTAPIDRPWEQPCSQCGRYHGDAAVCIEPAEQLSPVVLVERLDGNAEPIDEPEEPTGEPPPVEGQPDLPYPLTFCIETTPRGRWLKCEPFGGSALMLVVERDEQYWARPDVHDRYPVGMIIAVSDRANVLMLEDVDSGMPTWQGFFVLADDVAGSIEVSGEMP